MNTRPQFVLFGSSIVQYSYYGEGWGATLAHLYARKADIVLRGYASWNSKRALEVMDELFPKDATKQPALVIVYFGGNDSFPSHPEGIGPHVPIKDYTENMRKIAIHLKTYSEKSRLIFLSTPPINKEHIDNIPKSEGEKSRNEIRKEYSDACLEVCKELKIKAIDLWSAIQKRENWKNVCFIQDGVHFSVEGNKIVSNEILKVLKKPKWEPSLYWKLMPAEFGKDSKYDPVNDDGKSNKNVSNDPFPHKDEDFEFGEDSKDDPVNADGMTNKNVSNDQFPHEDEDWE